MRSARPEKQNTLDSRNARLPHSARPTPVSQAHKSRNPLLTSAVAKIDAVQAEYSAFETVHETDGLIETAKELGVAYVAYSPLGHGWLVDNFDYNSPDDFAPDDFRRNCESSQSLPTRFPNC
jgi:aryl-alcohol dehydrogenase-like predicted oxidoreductase